MNQLDLQIGKKISAIRKDSGMTQAELAKKLGVTIKHISECERGVSSFSLDKMIMITDIFGCSLDYLIKGEAGENVERALK